MLCRSGWKEGIIAGTGEAESDMDNVRHREAIMSIGVLLKYIVLSLLGVAFIWFVAVSLPFHIGDWDAAPFPLPMGTVSLIAWVPMILGACVILWCYGLFISIARGTPWPFDPPRKLVVAGPYRFVRNPMEVGFFLILLGEALLFRSIAVVAYWLIGLAILYLRGVLFEEPGLRRRFGAAYGRYRKSVPRWIPRLRPYRQDE